MHVGFYSPAWPPGNTANGVVTYVRIVRDELRRRGHKVTVFSSRCESSEREGVVRVANDRRSTVLGAVRRRLGFASDGVYGFGATIADAVARRHAAEPLHVFEMEESFGWCEAVAGRLRLPTVVKLHGPAFLSLIDGGEETPERRTRIWREGQALRAQRAVISPSASTLAATAARYALNTAVLANIPNPVAPIDESLVWQADRAEANDILFVGRFDFRKGGDAILAAFSRVVAVRPAARLTFVGPDAGLRRSSGEVQHFAEYVRASLAPAVAERICFLGSQPAAEIVRLRSRAALTVATTRWESFGYVIAEAMNQGCPVVGFDVDGVNELIEHEKSGLLAPLDDLEGLARLICGVLDDRRFAASLGRGAREAITASCGAERVVGQMLSLYQRLVDAKAARGGR